VFYCVVPSIALNNIYVFIIIILKPNPNAAVR
jgi:hypothetical protein